MKNTEENLEKIEYQENCEISKTLKDQFTRCLKKIPKLHFCIKTSKPRDFQLFQLKSQVIISF